MRGPLGRPIWAAALLLLAAVAVMVTFQYRVRIWEAGLSGAVINALAVFPTHAQGVAIVFAGKGRSYGLGLTPECSAVLLIAPFAVLTAGLLATRRISLARGLGALAVVAALLFTVNQIRLLVIAWSMRQWGITTGYERSHVLIGSALSTVALVAGIAVFLFALLGHARRRPQPPA